MTRFYHNSKLLYRLYSVLFHKTYLTLPAVLLLVFFSITSCLEEPTIIGTNLLPGTDFVNILSDSTIHPVAYTIVSDSMVTNSRNLSYLGTVTDPYFGDTETDFVAQLKLLKKWTGTELPQIDSVMFYINLSGAKGILDSTTTHQIKIFEINEILSPSVKYFSNRDPNAGTELATVILPPIAKDTVISKGIRIIPLDAEVALGNRLMGDTSKLSQDINGNPFISYFKGIYVKMVNSPSPFLIAVDFTSANLSISVYYHDSQGIASAYNFVVNNSSVRYNRYIHKYNTATSPLKVNLQNFRNKTKDSLIYLQAFNGVYPQIEIPQLKAIKQMLWDSIRNVPKGSINKARLTFTAYIDSNIFTATTVPPQINMKYSQSDTAQYKVPDLQMSTDYFGGTFNASSKTYSFNLAAFVQEYIKGKISNPVVDMYYDEGEYRSVILKANNGHPRVKFEFTYTIF